jgi:hypothetical protein
MALLTMAGQSSWISTEKISCGHGTEVKCGPKFIGRRQSSIAGLAFLGGATIAIGCEGGSNNPTSPTTTTPQNQNIGVVSGNHPMPHIAVISFAPLCAGNGIILDISSIRTR